MNNPVSTPSPDATRPALPLQWFLAGCQPILEWKMDIITIGEARAQNLLYYFTGKPCKHGHISKRIVYSGGCYRCAQESSKSSYRKNPELKKQAMLKALTPEAIQRRRERSREPAAQNAYYKKKYGISYDDFLHMCEVQQNKCVICRKELVFGGSTNNSAMIDHCHVSTNVRGVLCGGCNKGLGHFNDNIQTLLRAIEYLKFYDEAVQ